MKDLAANDAERTEEPTFYWTRHTNGGGQWNTRSGRRQPAGPPGADLAALRRGVGREPGSVPAMWPFYLMTNPDGTWTREYAAEHAALTLFATHQQSQARPMHRRAVGLPTAVLALRQHRPATAATAQAAAAAEGQTDRQTPDWSKIDAVDRRFNAAATSADLTELVMHLRGLVTQLRGIGQPLDYTRLYQDLRDWQYPSRVSRVRRRWGMQYFTRTPVATATITTDSSDNV
jgi:CRISPR system Cascade subunit CasB